MDDQIFELLGYIRGDIARGKLTKEPDFLPWFSREFPEWIKVAGKELTPEVREYIKEWVISNTKGESALFVIIGEKYRVNFEFLETEYPYLKLPKYWKSRKAGGLKDVSTSSPVSGLKSVLTSSPAGGLEGVLMSSRENVIKSSCSCPACNGCSGWGSCS